MMLFSNRITIDPQICHGKPCVRSIRWSVEVIMDMMSSGMTAKKFLLDHPELEPEDIFSMPELRTRVCFWQGISDFLY